MRGASATSVCKPHPSILVSPPPHPRPSVTLSSLPSIIWYLPPFCFKEKSSWCQGHAHHQIPGASVSGPWPGISLSLTVACLG